LRHESSDFRIWFELTVVNIAGDLKGRAASELNASIMILAMRAVLRTIDGHQCDLVQQKA
jgi:hypothetical protein